LSERPAVPDSRQAIDERASVLVARLQADPDAAERQAISDWIEADPRHAVAFARMEAAWDLAGRLRANPPPLDRTPLAPPVEADQWLSRRRVVAGFVAATTVAGVGTAAWRYARDVDLYRTQVGERRTVVVSDGSRIHLNTGSTIEVAMKKDRRLLRLVRGEALFEVAHDKQRPFLVDAASARMRAVGTAFNVRIRENVVELTVTEGVVAVVQTGDSVRRPTAAPHITAGDGAIIRSDAVAPTALDDQVLRQRTAWQDGVIELEGETLPQAVEEFNRYRVQPIIVGDARLANIRVGGRFEVDEADKFLTALASSFPVDAIKSADGTILLVARQ
jgi:transmembrane sensor